MDKSTLKSKINYQSNYQSDINTDLSISAIQTMNEINKVQVYASTNNVNVCSETLLSENSHYVVTSQLIYNANELIDFHFTKAFTKYGMTCS